MKLEESGEKHKGNRQRTVIAGRVKIPRKDSRRTIPSPVNTRSENKNPPHSILVLIKGVHCLLLGIQFAESEPEDDTS